MSEPLAPPTPRTLLVKGVEIGAGRPKTIVPTTGTTVDSVLAQARSVGANAAADLLEWRIDFLDIATDANALLALAPQVAAAARGKPVLLTFRTQAEGGQRAITDVDYGALYAALIRGRAADLYDVEMFRDAGVVRQLVADAHATDAFVVMSNHDFHATPATTEIVARLRHQEALGADVLKIAVMPQHPGDVLRLLEATWRLRQFSDRPLLTMSMGALGMISRLSGSSFGQALTFGMIGSASAPGQLDVSRLHDILEALHAGQSTRA